MQKIYVVEDDPNIRTLIATALHTGGFETCAFDNGEALLPAISKECPALVLLDIMLPGESGLTILGRLRAMPAYQALPVILLTAKSEEIDKVMGLDLGADDYITKPFGILELISRVKLALRHADAQQTRPPKVPTAYKDISIDHLSKEIRKNGVPLHLTYKEYELFLMLLANKGVVISREQIMSSIWGFDFDGGARTVDVHINSLRQKLGDNAENPSYIATARGHGYKLLREE